jgi:hypothetical protein
LNSPMWNITKTRFKISPKLANIRETRFKIWTAKRKTTPFATGVRQCQFFLRPRKFQNIKIHKNMTNSDCISLSTTRSLDDISNDDQSLMQTAQSHSDSEPPTHTDDEALEENWRLTSKRFK